MGEIVYAPQFDARPSRAARISTVARILLVDADPAALAAMTQALQSEGYVTAAAFDAPGAIAVAERLGPFDLLIVDVASTDELPLVSKLRHRRDGELHVLYLAGPGRGWVARDADDEVIEKPFSESELVDAVSSLLSWKAPRSTR